MSPRCRCSVFERNQVQAATVRLGSDLHLVGLLIEESDPFWNLMGTLEIG